MDCFLEGFSDPFLLDKLLASGCKVNMIYGEGGNEKYICLKCFQESSLNGILAVRPKSKGLTAGDWEVGGRNYPILYGEWSYKNISSSLIEHHLIDKERIKEKKKKPINIMGTKYGPSVNMTLMNVN